MLKMFKQKRNVGADQRMMELGPEAMVDLNQISAVYTKMNCLVIRIGGMGVIELRSDQLHQSIEHVYRAIAKEVL